MLFIILCWFWIIVCFFLLEGESLTSYHPIFMFNLFSMSQLPKIFPSPSKFSRFMFLLLAYQPWSWYWPEYWILLIFLGFFDFFGFFWDFLRFFWVLLRFCSLFQNIFIKILFKIHETVVPVKFSNILKFMWVKM